MNHIHNSTVIVSDQLVSALTLQQPQPEGISSGGTVLPTLNCQRSPFNVVLIQFVDNRLLSRLQCTCALSFLLLRLVVSHSLLSTDERFSLFPAILVAQELVGTMGNTPPIWMWCWDIFVVILSWWTLYICVWGPGRDFAPLRMEYTPFASSLSFHFNLQLSTSRRSILLF